MIDQNKLVLDYLTRNGTITAWQAMTELGIGRLSARIYDLRGQGYDISMQMQTGRNRYGKAVTYGVYRLEGDIDESGQLRIL